MPKSDKIKIDNINKDKLVLITGATFENGYQIAHLFARQGYNLLITSDSDDVFNLRDKLMEFGTDVEALRSDFSRYSEIEKICEIVTNSDFNLSAVLLNLAKESYGAFDETELQLELKMAETNCPALIHLAKLIIPELLNFKNGKLIFYYPFSKDNSTQYSAVYKSLHSFLETFSQSLNDEYSKIGLFVNFCQSLDEIIKLSNENPLKFSSSDIGFENFIKN